MKQCKNCHWHDDGVCTRAPKFAIFQHNADEYDIDLETFAIVLRTKDSHCCKEWRKAAGLTVVMGDL